MTSAANIDRLFQYGSMPAATAGPVEHAGEYYVRRAARNSLISFTQYTKPDFRPAAHHRWIADALEKVERGEIKRLMLFMPPRHGKSELASRRFPAWYLGRNPDKQIITATYSAEFAQDFGRDVREIVRGDDYIKVFNTQLSADSTARDRWRTQDGGVYFAVGVGGPITGRGAHLALIDDPVKNREDAESETLRNAAYNWYTSTLRTRMMSYDDGGEERQQGAIVLICTRWHEDDLAGRLLAAQESGGERWHVISLQGIHEEDGEEKALWPEFFPLDYLKATRSAIGPRDWLSLYQQTPTSEEGTFFKREWFQPYKERPEKLTVYMTGDFAVTADAYDFTEIGVWGIDADQNIYALDWYSGQTTTDVWITELLNRVALYEPQWFVAEGGVIRRAVEPWLKKQMLETKTYTACEWLPTSGNKPAMARSFQAMASAGKVRIPLTVWGQQLIDQLMKFPAGKHDDKVDACGLLGRFIAKTWAPTVKPAPKLPSFTEPLLVRDFQDNRRGVR